MINRLFYFLIVLPISFLPFPILYGISNFLYFILYSLAGYRKDVVHQNLVNSFPEKSKKEILEIEKEFFRHFCDLLVESIKAFTISREEANRRFKTRNPELPNYYFDQGKSLMITGGHYGNWEFLAITVDMQIKHQALALYTKLHNTFFDRVMKESRSRFGLQLVSTKEYREKGIEKYKQQLTATIFGTDQSPKKSQRAYWMKFLNQDTAVQYGAERFARKYNVPVLYGDIHRIKRGYFEMVYHLICEHPEEMPEGKITEAHTKMLEKIVRERPHYWLWSHKRWKLKRP